MNRKSQLKIFSIAFVALASSYSFGHGLMVNPPARNAVCGLAADQKPDNATNPACIEAFANDSRGGYEFMSVLTHDVGRKGVSPLPSNVCGFDSEAWDDRNNFTPWDIATDWPTTSITSGPLDIVWDINWGPHFDDTQEFVYYITKPGFNFQVGVPLKWSDFESTPFCDLSYSDSSPGANSNVKPDKAGAKFTTSCNVPSRSGRHVIYGEWGRNYFTYERFHGCLDVTFGGAQTNNPPSASPQSVSVPQNGNVGISLSGTDSDGSVVGYEIVNTPSNGSLSGSGANRTYTPNNNYAGSDSFTFRVRDDDGAASASATVSISVLADTGGDNVPPQADFSFSANLLNVSFNAGASVDPDSGPQALSYEWDFGDGSTGSGRTVSHTYSAAGAYSVALTVRDGEDSDQASELVNVSDSGTVNDGLDCAYVISNSWSTGFVAEIRLTNNGTSTVDGWEVNWSYNDGTVIVEDWSASFSGSGPYTASNLDWNSLIPPGQTVMFGFRGLNGGAAQVPQVSGEKCN